VTGYSPPYWEGTLLNCRRHKVLHIIHTVFHIVMSTRGSRKSWETASTPPCVPFLRPFRALRKLFRFCV